MHQYYNMAPMINADVHRLFPSIDITMKTRLNSRADLSKEKPPTLKGAMDEYFYQKYGESKQVRYREDDRWPFSYVFFDGKEERWQERNIQIESRNGPMSRFSTN